MNTLTFVPPNELHDYWDLVKPGLEIVRQKSSDGWLCEDVYTELRAGRSTLHIGDVEGDYAGFVVLTPTQGYDSMRLFIWAAYNATDKDMIKEFLPELKSMAKKIKAKKLTFSSCRKGWDKRMAQYGFEPTFTRYDLEI